MKTKFVGLKSTEVIKNRKKYGENVVPESAKKSWLYFFIDVYRNRLNMILVSLLIVFLVLALLGYGGYTDVVGIGSVLLVIGVIGATAKSRAQKYAIELKRSVAVRFYNVIRDNSVSRIDSREIVVGDVVKSNCNTSF